MEEKTNNVENTGIVKISDEVVSTIAGITASEIVGISAMSNTLTSGIAEILGGKKNPARGIKVEIKENDVSIEMHVIVEFGARIPEVAWELQEKVKQAVESMTGLAVQRVNVHVDGINLLEEKKQEQLELELDDTDL